jgi:signal transduction histidine kinase
LQIYTQNIQSLYEYGNIPPVLTNSFHLEQAILNVINNAIDAMHQGGLLKICTSTEERAGKIFAVVAVSDTGQGIAEAERSRAKLPAEPRRTGEVSALYHP